MESSSNKPKDKNKDNECVKTNNIIENIKNKYIFQKIYDNVPKKQKLEIVKYNKKMQNKLIFHLEVVNLLILMNMIKYIIIYILMIIKKK